MSFPVNTIYELNVGLTLIHRLRRWPNIKPALGQRPVLAGGSHAGQWKNIPSMVCLHHMLYHQVITTAHRSAAGQFRWCSSTVLAEDRANVVLVGPD